MMTNVDQTLDNVVIEFTPYAIDNADSGVYMFGNIYAQTMNVGWSDSSLGATAYTTSTAIVDNMYYITPSNENTTAVEVGYLALGAGDDKGGTPTQQFGSTQWPIVTWNLPGYFWKHNITPSFSYTLHVGSVALDYPLSLIFGGYDQGRVIGAPTTFNEPPSLLDIGIGVQTGGSPFNFTSRSGLLIDSSGSNKAISASPDSQRPYMALPQQTCDTIAAVLPVNFDDDSGYYLWETDDPLYERIVSSPTYLFLTFPLAIGGTSNVIIKVPFTLLNLTLGPLLSGKTQPVPSSLVDHLRQSKEIPTSLAVHPYKKQSSDETGTQQSPGSHKPWTRLKPRRTRHLVPEHRFWICEPDRTCRRPRRAVCVNMVGILETPA